MTQAHICYICRAEYCESASVKSTPFVRVRREAGSRIEYLHRQSCVTAVVRCFTKADCFEEVLLLLHLPLGMDDESTVCQVPYSERRHSETNPAISFRSNPRSKPAHFRVPNRYLANFLQPGRSVSLSSERRTEAAAQTNHSWLELPIIMVDWDVVITLSSIRRCKVTNAGFP